MRPNVIRDMKGRDLSDEYRITQEFRLAASKRGYRLWRNNNGAVYDEKTKRLIRYGLCNDSSAVNKKLKSSDLIGITPYTVKQEDVGKIIGIFTSIEIKHSGWKWAGTEREQAQLNWINLITSLGGIAYFASSTEKLHENT